MKIRHHPAINTVLKRTTLAIAVTFALLPSGRTLADTLYVPGEYPTIQEAIDAAAVSGDEIIVAPGSYNEAIDFTGKAIYLHSSDGPDVTTIDATGIPETCVVKCISSEGPATVLEGFTITGGEGVIRDPNYPQFKYGGGMYNLSTSPTVNNCTFTGNPAFYGGGIYNHLSAPTITGCTFSSTGVSQGGGIYNHESSTAVSDCVFVANEVNAGGGIFNHRSNAVTITTCTFDDNHAVSTGAGIHSFYSDTTLTDCTFTVNTTDPSGLGGGIYSQGDESVITDCTFTDNDTGDWGKGGGMYEFDSDSTITNCSFSGNWAGLGGGLYSNGSSSSLTGCEFISNSCYSGGGAISVEGSGTPTLLNCDFNGNWTLYDGGAIRNHYGFPRMISCLFSANSADRDGGAILNSSSSPQAINCLFFDNYAVGRGGAVFNYGYDYPTPEMINCTLTANTAFSGGAVFSSDEWGDHNTPLFDNCILWGNTPDQVVDHFGATTTVNYSDVQGGWLGAGTNNIDDDPLFVDPINGDCHVGAGSPVIDAANNDAVPPDITTDLDGNPRFVDDPDTPDTGNGTPPMVDMGAFEFQVAIVPPTLSVLPDPLIAGQSGQFRVINATPRANTYLVYSLRGLGSTFVAPLNVTLDLRQPKQAGSAKRTDRNGSVRWVLPIPAHAAGIDLWLQAVQFENKTNVVATRVTR